MNKVLKRLIAFWEQLCCQLYAVEVVPAYRLARVTVVARGKRGYRS